MHPAAKRWLDAIAADPTSWDLERLLHMGGQPEWCDPRDIVAGLRSADRRTRVRTALVLRKLLVLPYTEGIRRAVVLEDPLPRLRSHLGLGLQEVDLPDILKQLATNPAYLPWSERTEDLSASSRLWLASALLERLEPTALPETHRGQPTLVHQPISLARVVFAARLGSEEYLLVMRRLDEAPPELRALILLGLYQAWSSSPQTAEPLARQLSTLLVDPDPNVADLSARFAALLMAEQPVDVLVARVRDLAVEAVAGDTSKLRCSTLVGWCLDIPDGPPQTRAGILVMAAARAGEARLIEPLLTLLPAAERANGPTAHACFVMQCLSDLVPLIDARAARRVHDTLRFVNSPDSWGHSLARLRRRLYAVIPDDFLADYESLLAQRAMEFSKDLVDLDDLMPAARVRRVWPHQRPELLRAAWNEGGAAPWQTIGLTAHWWRTRPERLLRCVREGELPRDLAASALAAEMGLEPSLAQLAAVLPRGDGEALPWPRIFVSWLERLRLGTARAEVPWLAELAKSASWPVAHAAALRARRLGEAGDGIVAHVIEVGARDAQTAAVAARLAIECGVAPSDPARLAARLRMQDPELAIAIEARFAGRDILSLAAAQRLRIAAASRAELVLEQWREVLSTAAPFAIAELLGTSTSNCSPTNAVPILDLVGALPEWGSDLERAILHRTLDADPSVRLAAYRALHSRDRNLWACAWLAYEAEFDADPNVRAFAATLPR